MTLQHNRQLDELNAAQREAVTAPPGPLLIIAGAGSGKTRVLTHRIAHFIASGIPAGNICAITFTNKAAEEMRKRVSLLLTDQQPTTNDQRPLIESGLHHMASFVVSRESSVIAALPFLGTFHSLALRMLRENGTRIGIPQGFAVADDADSRAIMKRIMKRLGVSPDQLTPADALGRISHEKSELHGPDEMRTESEQDALIKELYGLYQKELRGEKLLDFDDLLMEAVRMLKESPDALTHYHARFRHLLVDEYQDTNTAQYVLVKLLAREHKSITVVGDDYQAIYGWRGADFRNILNFGEDFPGAKVVKLEENYRSTQSILDAADGIIKKVGTRTEKTLTATRPGGAPVIMAECADERDEAVYVLNEIVRMRKKGLKLSDIVVLYRTNAQSRPFEELLMQSRVPYRVIGGVRFYERREIKDIIAYLRYCANPFDRTSLERIVNVPMRGIGKVGLERIVEKGLESVATESVPAKNFLQLVTSLREKRLTQSLSDFVKDLTTTIRYRQHLKETHASARTWQYDDAEERWANVQELIATAKRYDMFSREEALERFLEDIALFSSADAVDTAADALNLMTMHLAKGLEFTAVFVAGCEEGLLPHTRSMFDPEQLDEERRLCYVALTRAKDIAHLTFARTRTTWGDRAVRMPSRFLSDIPSHLVDFHGKPLDEPELIDEWEE